MGFRPRPSTWLRPRRRFSKPWMRRQLVRAAAAQQRRKKSVQKRRALNTNSVHNKPNQKRGLIRRLFGF